MTDAGVEQLLSACPQLLRLRCVETESWQAVLIAARCCGHACWSWHWSKAAIIT